MKKTLVYSLIVLLFITSCKKDSKRSPDIKPEAKTYKVQFTVSRDQPTLAIASKKKANSPLTDQFEILYYYVLDGNNDVISRIVQLAASTPNFGKITYNLPAGAYKVIIFAGKGGLRDRRDGTTDSDYGDIISANNFFYNQNLDATSIRWKDTFYKQTMITVSGGDIVESVNLERVVGQLQINLEDVIPANAKRIVYAYADESVQYDFYEGAPNFYNGGTISHNVKLPGSAIGKANYKVEYLVMNTVKPMNVTITCYDASDAVLASVFINNVTVEANTLTILSGKLFGADKGFTITLNEDWDDTPIIINY